MSRLLLRLGIALVALALILGGVGYGQRDRIERLIAVNSLFEPDRIAWNFTHMDALFDTAPVPTGDVPVTPLPLGAPVHHPDGFDDWLERRSVMAIVMLRDGERVLERYRMGTGPGHRYVSWSVAKSYLSMLFGVILERGEIDSLDDPVTRYAPELAGSAYDGVTIRNVLQMASGVDFNEDYHDFWSDINRMGRVLALGGSLDTFAAGLDDRIRPPGEAWQYVSIDTHVLSMVLRGATGQSLADLMGRYIIGPMGVESDPYYLTDGHGTAFSLGGLNLTARDYARMGQTVANGGTLGGRRIVPAEWLAESTAPSAPTAPGRIRYGYQWWIPADARPGEVLAQGVYGQYVYVDRQANVVIAVNGADRAFRQPGVLTGDVIPMFRRLRDMAARGS